MPLVRGMRGAGVAVNDEPDVTSWPLFTEGFAESRRQRKMVARGALVGASRSMRRALIATVIWRRSWRWWLALPLEVSGWACVGAFIHNKHIADGDWGDDEPFRQWLRMLSLDEVRAFNAEVAQGRLRAENPRRRDELVWGWRMLESQIGMADDTDVEALPPPMVQHLARRIASVRARRAPAGERGSSQPADP